MDFSVLVNVFGHFAAAEIMPCGDCHLTLSEKCAHSYASVERDVF